MRNALLAVTTMLLVLATLHRASEAERNPGRRRDITKGHMEVTCAQIKPEDVCNHTMNYTKGFQVFDGCNLCTCGAKPGKMICSIKSCQRQDKIQDDSRMRSRVDNFCANLARKVQRRVGRFIRKKMKDNSNKRSWPVKCFKEQRLCRDQPGVDFFDGCNQCVCLYPPAPAPAAPAQCELDNTCPAFYGTRREFKRHCRKLGASIAGLTGNRQGRGRRRGARRRARGNRRRHRKQQGKAEEDSEVQEDVNLVLQKHLI